MIRILQVIGGMNRGGAETFLMNTLRSIDRDRYDFVFLCYGDKPFDYEEEIVSLGSRIVRVPGLGSVGPFRYVRNITRLIRDESIDIVHAHTYYNSMFALIAAKIAGVCARVTHSHSTRSRVSSGLIKTIYYRLSGSVIRHLSTHMIACGHEAGLALYGKGSNFTIINNAIDLDSFKFSDQARGVIRSELGISSDQTMVLHVGRFDDVKNHNFLVDIFNSYLAIDNGAVLVLAGKGPLEDSIKDKVRDIGISDSVKFLGLRGDTKALYSAADVFVFPSIYEGLPVVLVEAQASGLPCIISDGIDRSADIGGDVKFVSLSDGSSSWARLIAESSKTAAGRVGSAASLKGGDYDVASMVDKLGAIYDAAIADKKIRME